MLYSHPLDNLENGLEGSWKSGEDSIPEIMKTCLDSGSREGSDLESVGFIMTSKM